MIQSCIFDLDGTLLNTLTSLEYTVNHVLEHFGYEPIDEDHVRRFVGDGYEKLLERALQFRGDEKLEHLQESKKVYMDFFAVNSMYQVKPYDGIVELLEELKKRGIKIAVLSNKPNAQTVEIIDTVFGKGYFDSVAGERPGVPRKPDTAGVKLILEEFQVQPENCLYLGDTDTDMKTGLGAGLVTVGVTWGFRDRGELESFHPQYVIDHPREVLENIL